MGSYLSTEYISTQLDEHTFEDNYKSDFKHTTNIYKIVKHNSSNNILSPSDHITNSNTITELTNQIKHLTKEKYRLKNILLHNDSNSTESHRSLNKYIYDISILKINNDTLTNENISLKQINKNFQDRYQLIISELENHKLEHNNILLAEKNLYNISNEINSLENHIISEYDNIKINNDALNNFENNINVIEQKLKSTINELQTKIQQLEDENRKLKFS